MDGYLIVFKTESQGEANKLRRELIGRISKVKDQFYYYSGLLDSTIFLKINRGCYFSANQFLKGDRRVELIPVKLNIILDESNTGRNYWLKYSKDNNIQVKNI